jgi:ADP-ribose pyrophosphatase YjhB (NUDIX family)
MSFCIQCGHALELAIPAGDTRQRLCCPACGYIHYQNPKILVSCITYWQDKVLWMRRAQPPRQGLWSIPSGFMERGETLRAAAARELFEETRVKIAPEALTLYIIGTITALSEVYVVFRGRLDSPTCGVGEEALETGLFSASDAPWDNFAFPEVEGPTRRFYEELGTGHFGVYMGEYTELGNRFWPVPVPD